MIVLAACTDDRGNVQGSAADSADTAAACAADDPCLVWTADYGEPPVGPVAGDGVVLVPADGATRALEGATGAERWAYEPEFIDLNMQVDAGVALASTADGLQAFELDSGDVRWTFDGAESSALGDGVVWVIGDHAITELDLETGVAGTSWTIESNVWGYPRVDGELLCTANEEAYVLNLATGAVLIDDAYGSDVGRGSIHCAVSAGVAVFAWYDLEAEHFVGGATAWDAATGTELWTRDEPEAWLWAPIVAAGTLLLGRTTADRVPSILALDLATGEEIWEQPTAGYDYAPHPLVVGELVGDVSDEGVVEAWSVATGDPAWTLALDEPVSDGFTLYGWPTAADGWVYAATSVDGTGRLYAVRGP